MSKVLVSLVGHQPLPNLIVIRYERPDYVLFLTSGEDKTTGRLNNIKSILERDARKPGGHVIQFPDVPPVDPWDMRKVAPRLQRVIQREGLQNASLVLDVTGGTKAMSIALAYSAAHYKAEMVYLVSDRLQTELWRYRIIPSASLALVGDKPEHVSALLEIEDWLYVYLGKQTTQDRTADQTGKWFAHDVMQGFQRLDPSLEIQTSRRISSDEEIDILLRKRNRFAIVECKWQERISKDPGMDAIFQLNNLASERHLGTYTAKIWALRAHCSKRYRDIAAAHDIHVLSLPEWENRGSNGFDWTTKHLEYFESVARAAFGG